MSAFYPLIANKRAECQFQQLAQKLGYELDSCWVDGYVNYEWDHSRLVFEHLSIPILGQDVLEFGCNMGATAIILALMKAQVTAIDVNPECIQLTKLNAAKYGVESLVRCLHVPDTCCLPFPNETFDRVVCNSVLEYVPWDILNKVQGEIDRVLRPGGEIIILGTSSRLWPKEVHSNRWFVNWIPCSFDKFFATPPQRGLSPWRVRYGFGPGYENVDLFNRGQEYLNSRKTMGISPWKYKLLFFASLVARFCGTSLGLLAPNIAVRLRKNF